MNEQGQTQKQPISGARGLAIVMGGMVGLILVMAAACIILAP